MILQVKPALFDVSLVEAEKGKRQKLNMGNLVLHKGVHCYFSTKVVIGSEAQAWAASEAV